jgi:hypothetical protein
VKKVVVFPLGSFVQRAGLGVADDPEPTLLNQKLQVAINGGLVERLYAIAAHLKDLLHPEGPILLQKDFHDCISLGRLSSHVEYLSKNVY